MNPVAVTAAGRRVSRGRLLVLGLMICARRTLVLVCCVLAGSFGAESSFHQVAALFELGAVDAVLLRPSVLCSPPCLAAAQFAAAPFIDFDRTFPAGGVVFAQLGRWQFARCHASPASRCLVVASASSHVAAAASCSAVVGKYQSAPRRDISSMR